MTRIRTVVLAEAEIMLGELEEFYLHVELLPAPEPMHTGHKVRTVVNENPAWYKYAWGILRNSNRERIKRTLARIVGRRCRRGMSDSVLLDIATARADDLECDAHGMLRSEREDIRT